MCSNNNSFIRRRTNFTNTIIHKQREDVHNSLTQNATENKKRVNIWMIRYQALTCNMKKKKRKEKVTLKIFRTSHRMLARKMTTTFNIICILAEKRKERGVAFMPYESY
jgi:hypothetical protein